MPKSKSNKPKWRQEGNRQVASLYTDPVDYVKSVRRANRQVAIENGTLTAHQGTGTHGGNKRSRNRQDRKANKLNIQRGSFE